MLSFLLFVFETGRELARQSRLSRQSWLESPGICLCPAPSSAALEKHGSSLQHSLPQGGNVQAPSPLRSPDGPPAAWAHPEIRHRDWMQLGGQSWQMQTGEGQRVGLR